MSNLDKSFDIFRKRVLKEAASAFKKRSEAQDFVNTLNGNKSGHPFYVKKIAKDLFQIAYRTDTLSEQYFDDIKIFDRIFVAPGEDHTADVWLDLQKYNVRNNGRKLESTVRTIENKIKRVKTPSQLYDPKVRNAIQDASSQKINENVRGMLAAGILGASSLMGTGFKEQPYEPKMSPMVRTQSKETRPMDDYEKFITTPRKTKILDAKRYVEYLTKQEKDPLLLALVKHESKFDPAALGDRNLKDHAYGILQIRKPALIDVNETFGTNYTVQDLVPKDATDKDSIDLAVKNSIDVYRKYLERYKLLNASNEEKAKFWNGGPIVKKMMRDPGVQKRYPTISDNVDKYWKSVKSLLG